jgi:hypothetical protein
MVMTRLNGINLEVPHNLNLTQIDPKFKRNWNQVRNPLESGNKFMGILNQD